MTTLPEQSADNRADGPVERKASQPDALGAPELTASFLSAFFDQTT
jgi:hypothetical protein